MKILCVFGQHNYGVPDRGQGYEYSNFLPALHNLGHDVIFFESFNKSYYADFADLNIKLLEMVQSHAPDAVIFVFMNYEIWLETLEVIRDSTSALLIAWATDDSWKYEQSSRFMAKPFDVYATTYAEALEKSRKDGYANFILTQWAASKMQLLEPVPAKKCTYNVTFVGSAFGNRRKTIEELALRGITVECFGYGWANGPVSEERMRQIIRESVISLNFGDSDRLISGVGLKFNRQIKARNFQVPGCGGFLLTEALLSLENFYIAGSEIVSYEGIDDLAEKINYYLLHTQERDEIARAGYIRTVSDHTYEKRFEELLLVASKLSLRRGRGAPRIDLSFFSKHVQHHRANYLVWLLKWFFVLPCWIIWGHQKGTRAARRLMFELCWRISGARTYSCHGIPGRLFYKES